MQTKKIVYLIASTLLGVLLSYLVHLVIEIQYLNNAVSTGEQITWYLHLGARSCALSPVTQYSLLFIGIIAGFVSGLYWWKAVYVDKRHWRFRRKEKAEDQPNQETK